MSPSRRPSMRPAWIVALASALERVTGGVHPHDVGGAGVPTHGSPIWEPLPAGAAGELAAWWGWVESLPVHGVDHLPVLPPKESALSFGAARDYAAFTRQLAVEAWDDPDDMWKASYVPLTGDADAAYVVDVADPRLPVYLWWLEVGLEPAEPIGFGVAGLAEQMTALLNAGCYRYDASQQRFVRRRHVPLPHGFGDDHPLIGWAGSSD